jgi:chemotaxis protein CheC
VSTFSEIQLDALRELANVGSGNAGTALSGMLGRSVDISVPRALALPLADAVEAAGPADAEVTAVVLPLVGDMDAAVLLLFADSDVTTLCGLLGVEPGTEVGLSALGEIGNIVGTSYVNALCLMIGLEVEPAPPQVLHDLLGAIVATALTAFAPSSDLALMLDSELRVEGEECSLSFVLVPSADGVNELLTRLGLGS